MEKSTIQTRGMGNLSKPVSNMPTANFKDHHCTPRSYYSNCFQAALDVLFNTYEFSLAAALWFSLKTQTNRFIHVYYCDSFYLNNFVVDIDA